MTGSDEPLTDAARPPKLLVAVTDIRRHLGTRKDLHRVLPAHGLTLSDAAVPEGVDIAFDGEVESIHDGVVLTGVVTVPWTGVCRRCLRTDVAGTATADVREIYEVRPSEGDTWPLENDQIDLGPLLHDTALLTLPLAPLCRDDCEGPAPEVFPTGPAGRDQGAAVEDEPAKDPRWAALDDLDL